MFKNKNQSYDQSDRLHDIFQPIIGNVGAMPEFETFYRPIAQFLRYACFINGYLHR
jgi:hypothetical protein